MASLIVKNGATSIQFYDRDETRKTISLGKKFSSMTGQELKGVIEKLVYFRDNPSLVVDKRTLVWIETAPDIIREKLAAVGLIKEPQKQTCQELWNTYLDEIQAEIKQTTFGLYETAKRRFFSFFDKDR